MANSYSVFKPLKCAKTSRSFKMLVKKFQTKSLKTVYARVRACLCGAVLEIFARQIRKPRRPNSLMQRKCYKIYFIGDIRQFKKNPFLVSD